MPFLHKVKNSLSHYLTISPKNTRPEKAYNLWAESYDNQPDNLMLALDKVLFNKLIDGIVIKDKRITDIGCGTGRHWKQIMDKAPEKLIGYDVSKGMLGKLRYKYPLAETHLIENNLLRGLANESCDLIISTLAIAHIKDTGQALQEWNRVLKPGGDIIITDYHPVALEKGGDRTFCYNNKLIAVKNYIHPLQKLRILAHKLHFRELAFIEEYINDDVKSYYENKNALHIFEQFEGAPIIYGIHFTKP